MLGWGSIVYTGNLYHSHDVILLGAANYQCYEYHQRMASHTANCNCVVSSKCHTITGIRWLGCYCIHYSHGCGSTELFPVYISYIICEYNILKLNTPQPIHDSNKFSLQIKHLPTDNSCSIQLSIVWAPF